MTDETEKEHWCQAMHRLADMLAHDGAHPSRTMVLVPYAQLIPHARAAWSLCIEQKGATATFVPQFQTSMTWAAGLLASGGAMPATGDDMRMDAAIDILTASSLLARAGLGAQQHTLAGRLLESAWSLARVAAAQAPADRLAWGSRLAAELNAGLQAPALALELALGRIALIWAATSAYPSDVLFTPEAADHLDMLVLMEGFQSEPLVKALKAHFGPRALLLELLPLASTGLLALHEAIDTEDEAHRAAACVMAHLAAQRSPVALIAQDRLLTRRVHAILAEQQVALRDETGWKLSTTRAAAAVMSLLRALPWDASSDAVLDWLKNAPACDARQTRAVEVALRKAGLRYWRMLVADEGTRQTVALVAGVRDGLQKTRTLASWLTGLRAALELAGQWAPLEADTAGAKVIEALRLGWAGQADTPDGSPPLPEVRMTLQDFTSWVNHTLEAANFSPDHADAPQVIILPLSQLLGRPMQAVVLPGADEVRLAVSPEPPGGWTPAQRAVLGLPSREETASAQRAAWNYALCLPHIDVLWRTSEAGERLMPSGFVQEVRLQHSPDHACDPRIGRSVALKATLFPAPTGEAVPVKRLSASAYEDLRRCPYRFFALRQLGLQASEELESELGKREFGNWLHQLLYRFHEALKAVPAQSLQGRIAMINIAADEAKAELDLTDSEFLPFAAIWPRTRAGYLEWLAAHEAAGAQFHEGEVWKEMPLGTLSLVGKIDRIDRCADGSHLLMDYKTEGRTVTQARIKDAQEDTQLAFYAALLEDDTLTAAYINLGEKEPTKTFAQDDIVALRDQLIDSILADMARIEHAAPLPALGEGTACAYCAARGLCRKDFW